MTKRTSSSRRRQPVRKKTGGKLKMILAGCLLVGLFVQISLLAQISGQAKALNKVNSQIRELTSAEEDLQVCLSMYQNLERIENRARALGMRLPDESQIRVVSLPGLAEDVSTQTAENTAAETSMR